MQFFTRHLPEEAVCSKKRFIGKEIFKNFKAKLEL